MQENGKRRRINESRVLWKDVFLFERQQERERDLMEGFGEAEREQEGAAGNKRSGRGRARCGSSEKKRRTTGKRWRRRRSRATLQNTPRTRGLEKLSGRHAGPWRGGAALQLLLLPRLSALFSLPVTLRFQSAEPVGAVPLLLFLLSHPAPLGIVWMKWKKMGEGLTPKLRHNAPKSDPLTISAELIMTILG